MSANNLTTTYRLLNSSFRKTMIFHLGIDAGFFPNIPICFMQCSIACNTRYSSSSIPTMPTSVGRKVGQLLRWHHFVQLEIGLKLRHALADILPYAIIAASVMAVTYYTARPIENIYVRLASKILLAMALYAAAMWASRSVTFKETIHYFIKKKSA